MHLRRAHSLPVHTHTVHTCPQPHVLTPATHSPPSQVCLHTQPRAEVSALALLICGAGHSLLWRHFTGVQHLPSTCSNTPQLMPTKSVSPHCHTSPGRGQNHSRPSTCGPDTPRHPGHWNLPPCDSAHSTPTQAHVPPVHPPPRRGTSSSRPRLLAPGPARHPGRVRAGGGGRPASLPVWRLSQGRGARGSNLQLIKCPSLMSFFN